MQSTACVPPYEPPAQHRSRHQHDLRSNSELHPAASPADGPRHFMKAISNLEKRLTHFCKALQ